MLNNMDYRSRTIFHQEGRRYNDNFIQENLDLNPAGFAQECLRCHNHFRAQHGSPPLHLSTEVSKFSQQWAEQIAKEDHLHHSHHPQYGENIFVTYRSDNSLPITKGHFTQVVWSNSRELGIGKTVSRTHRMYVVANYYPAGNIMNKFPMNVPKRVFSMCGRPHYVKRMSSQTLDSFHQEFCIESWTGH